MCGSRKRQSRLTACLGLHQQPVCCHRVVAERLRNFELDHWLESRLRRNVTTSHLRINVALANGIDGISVRILRRCISTHKPVVCMAEVHKYVPSAGQRPRGLPPRNSPRFSMDAVGPLANSYHGVQVRSVTIDTAKLPRWNGKIQHEIGSYYPPVAYSTRQVKQNHIKYRRYNDILLVWISLRICVCDHQKWILNVKIISLED